MYVNKYLLYHARQGRKHFKRDQAKLVQWVDLACMQGDTFIFRDCSI